MNEVDYRAVVAEIPDLAAQLAGAIIPSRPWQEGPSRSNEIAEGARYKAIDDLNRVMSFLADQADLWMPVLAALEFDTPEPVHGLEVSNGRYRKVVADDPLVAWRDARKIVAWLLAEWPDIEGHPLFYHLTDAIDERPFVDKDLPRDSSIVQLVHRLEVRKQEQTPADCERCFARDVWADIAHSSGVCASCGFVHRAEVWLSVREAAQRLEIGVSTIRGWVAEDRIPNRKSGRTSQVEWGATMEHYEYSRAKQKLNLKTGS